VLVVVGGVVVEVVVVVVVDKALHERAELGTGRSFSVNQKSVPRKLRTLLAKQNAARFSVELGTYGAKYRPAVHLHTDGREAFSASPRAENIFRQHPSH